MVSEFARSAFFRVAAIACGVYDTLTRKARADLVGLFDQDLDRELDEVIANWWRLPLPPVIFAAADLPLPLRHASPLQPHLERGVHDLGVLPRSLGESTTAEE